MRVEPNAKFACWFLTNARVASDWPDDELIAPGAYAARSAVAFDEHWAKWLGTFLFDEIRAGGLALYVTAPSGAPKVLDAENEALKTCCNDLLNALLIQGVPPVKEGFMVTGANVDGEIQVRQYLNAKELHTTYGLDFVPGKAHAERVGRIAQRLRAMLEATNGNWGRLLRATRVLLEANRMENHGERFHQFVRVLDALVKTRPNRGARDFAHRTQTFAVASEETAETLREMYDIRGAVEHVHHILDFVDVPDELSADPRRAQAYRVERANRMTRQLDVLARSTIMTILENAHLCDGAFLTDAAIDEFWALGNRERLEAWGPRVDIRTIK
jgi:hypothetical protein